MTPVKFLVIGYGHIGRRHSLLLKEYDEAELVAVVEIDTDKQVLASQECGVPAFGDVRSFGQSGISADVACICTPNGIHLSNADECLDLGMHVLIEKPMGLKADACRQIAAKAKELNLLVAGVMQNRFSPPAKWLRSLIDEEKLGEIYMVQVSCYWNRNKDYYDQATWRGTMDLDGGPLFTQFSHFVDTIYWLFGDVSDIQASFQNFNHQDFTEFEDSGIVSFKLPGGILGNFNYSTSVFDKNMESSMTIIGEKGSVRVGGQYMERIEYCHVEDYDAPELPPSGPPNNYGPYQGSAANHIYVFEEMIKELRGEPSKVTHVEEGAAVVDIIERVYALR